MTRQWLFDFPSDGLSLSTSNVRSEDNVAPQQVSPNSGTIQSSTAQLHAGTSSARFTRATSNTIARLPLESASQQAAVSLYAYMPSNTVDEGFFSLRYSGGPVAHIQISSSRALTVLVPGGGTTVYGSTGAVPVNTWVRVEAQADSAAGTVIVTSYLGDSLTPLGTVTHSALLVTSAFTHIDVGLPTGSTSGRSLYLDSIQTNSGSTALIGPYVLEEPPGSTAYIRISDQWLLADPYVAVGGEWVNAALSE